MKPTQEIIQINKENCLSVLYYPNKRMELAHLKASGVCYDFMDDVFQTENEYWLHNQIEEVIANIVAKAFDGEIVEENHVLIRDFFYDIYVGVQYYEGKVYYNCSTIHARDRDNDEQDDTNKVVRKTWKGLENYIARFNRYTASAV